MKRHSIMMTCLAAYRSIIITCILAVCLMKVEAVEWRERGLAWLKSAAETELTAVEALHIYRTFCLLGESQAESLVIVDTVDAGHPMDMPLVLAHYLRTGELADTPLRYADGGYAAESNGEGDLYATMMALRFLTEFEWIDERRLVPLFTYVEGELERMKAEHPSEVWRLTLDWLWVRLMYERYLGLNVAVHEGKTENEVLNCLEGLVQNSVSGMGAMDTGGLVRLLCTVGYRADAVNHVDALKHAQQADGSWTDRTAGSDVLTTCAVLEALAAYEAAIPADVTVNGETADVLDEEGEHAGIDFLVSVSESKQKLRTVACLYDSSGQFLESRILGQDGGMSSFYLGGYAPGIYTIVLRVFSEPGKVLLIEKSYDVTVEGWHSLNELSVRAIGNVGEIHSGEEVMLQPEAVFDFCGNETVQGMISWQLQRPDGTVELESGCESIVFIGNGRGHVESVTEAGGVRCSNVERTAALPPQVWTVGPHGIYLLRVTVDLEGKMLEGTLLFTVEDVSEIRVGQQVIPEKMPINASAGRVRICLSLKPPEENGLAARIDAAQAVILEPREGKTTCRMEITGIQDRHGRLLADGWIACRTSYGMLSSENQVVEAEMPCALCAGKVKNGRASFEFSSDSLDMPVILPVSVYSCLVSGGQLTIGDKIGQVDVMLSTEGQEEEP